MAEKRLTAQISDEKMRELKIATAKRDITIREAITEAISDWLKKQPK